MTYTKNYRVQVKFEVSKTLITTSDKMKSAKNAIM